MATGDVVETQAPRYEDNQRWDEDDAQSESHLRILREQMYTKGLLGGGLPFLSGVGETIGLVLQGGSITGQSGGSSLVTLGAELFAAIDADGLLIIKSAASGSVTVSCPIGTSTVYAFGIDIPDTNAQRAFIPPVAPFDEFFKGTNTRFTNKGGLVALSGDSTVNSAVVNGVTRPLVAIALVTNSGGNTTIVKLYGNVLHTVRPLALPLTNDAAFNIVAGGSVGATAWSYVVVARGRKGQVLKVSPVGVIPNGPAVLNNSGTSNNSISWTPLIEAEDYLIYRVSAGGTPSTTGLITPNPIVLPPGYTAGVFFNDTGFAGDNSATPSSTPSPEVVPTNSTDRGAGGSTSLTTNGMVRTLATLLADAKYKRSGAGTQANPQAASSNYGLYTSVRRGLDAVDRSTDSVWTIGDGVNTFGDFDAVNYASFDLLLADLFAAINLTTQVTLANSRVVLNDKFAVLIKPSSFGAYQLAADVTTPNNIIFVSEQSTSLSTTLTSSVGGFAINYAGRAVIVLNGHKMTLGAGCGMRNVFVHGGGGGQLVLNGGNKFDECSFVQAYGLGSPAGGSDPMVVCTSSPPSAGVSGLHFNRCRVFTFNNSGTQANSPNVYTTGILLTGVRDTFVDDCVFITDTQFTGYPNTQAPYMPNQLTFSAALDNVRVRRCRWDLYDDLFVQTGVQTQAGLRVLAAVGAEANKQMVIEECTFSLRNWRTGGVSGFTVAGGIPLYRAIQIDEEVNVSVVRCEFNTIPSGIMMTVSPVAGHTYNHFSSRFRDNTFNTCSTAIGLQALTAGTPTVRGLWVNDNTFVNCFRAVGLNYTGGVSATFNDVTIRRNKMFDFTVNGSFGIQIVALAVDNLCVDDNTVDNMNDTFFNLTFISSLSAVGQNISISRNVIDTIIRTGYTVGKVITLIGPGSLGVFRNVRIKDNQISDILAQATTPGGSEHVVTVSAGTLIDIDVSDNTFLKAGITFSGGTRPYHISLLGGFATGGDYFENIKVKGNNLGDSTSQFEALQLNKVFTGAATNFSRNFEIAGNQFVTNYVAGGAPQGVSWNLGDSGLGDKWMNVDHSHNKSYFETGGTTVTIPADSFELRLGTIVGLEFIGNMWVVGGGSSWGSGRGAFLVAAGGLSTSTKSAYNTAANTALSATGFTYFAAGSSTGNT